MFLSVSAVHGILSGERKGFWAALVRFVLLLMSGPYRSSAGLRNRLYDWRVLRAKRLNAKVISVGNLTTGGTGKTPLVQYLAEYVLSRGEKVGVVSRGYRASGDEPNDEKRLLSENLPSVPHIAGKNRYACGLIACERHGAKVILMDDGFQHRCVARDLDIVTVDATNPFGFGHVLPRGLLREPPGSLARADIVVITRSALVKPGELAGLEGEISHLAAGALIVRAEEQVCSVEDLAGNPYPYEELRGKRAVAFCGLGNPEAFHRTLIDLGVNVAVFLVFDDHHRYTQRDLRAIDETAAQQNVQVILTTQKDRVKIPASFHWQHNVLVVKIGMRITRGEAELKRRLDGVIEEEQTP